MPTAPHGSWASPVSSALVASGGVSLDELMVDGEDLYWLEGRLLEGGRQVLCRSAAGGPPRDQLPPQFNVRTRVHEYGGGSYAVHRGTVLFSNFGDQRLYRQDPDAGPRPITPEPSTPAGLRYADAVLDPDGAWLICVRESHDGDEVTNELVALPAGGSPGSSGTTRAGPGTGPSACWRTSTPPPAGWKATHPGRRWAGHLGRPARLEP